MYLLKICNKIKLFIVFKDKVKIKLPAKVVKAYLRLNEISYTTKNKFDNSKKVKYSFSNKCHLFEVSLFIVLMFYDNITPSELKSQYYITSILKL